MIRYHYRLCLIERGFSPTDLTMFYTTHAINDSGIFCLQDKFTGSRIQKINSPRWSPTVLLIMNYIVRLWLVKAVCSTLIKAVNSKYPRQDCKNSRRTEPEPLIGDSIPQHRCPFMRLSSLPTTEKQNLAIIISCIESLRLNQHIA